MKQNKIRRRLTAILLSAVFMFSGAMPVFAWTSGTGKRCSSKFGSQYLSSDGRNYMNVPDDYYCIHYHPDGSTTVDLMKGKYKVRRKLLLVDPATKEEKWVYCIEEGVDYEVSENGYISDNTGNSEYFLMLPYTARVGIMSVVLYGYHQGQTIPIAGLNADDAFFAGQVLIWEYQQGIRTDAGLRRDNGKIKADTFYNLLKGRPAEKMYNYLLEKIRKHSVIPSFASRNKDTAQTFTLEYNSNTGKYSKTLTDTNNSGENLQQLTKYGLTVTRSGNQYTITSDKPIDTAVSAEFRKDIPIGTDKMLIWGRPGSQTVCTGAEDPITFYLNIKTEAFGSLKLVKTAEDGKVSDIYFHIQGNGVNQTVKTNSAGEFQIDELKAGIYTVSEQTEEPYEPQESRRVTVVPGRVTNITFHNTLKRGNLKVTKSSEDGLNTGIRFMLSGTALNGAGVKLYAETDSKGVALFEDVPVSKSSYVLEEIDTGIQYVIPEKQNVTVKWNEVTYASFKNVLKKWRATVTKSDSQTGTAQGDASLAGAVYGVYKGEQLIDTYTTGSRGQFVTDWYVCGKDWTIREITQSEGYLLDTTIHKAGAEPGNFAIEHNELGMDVKEQVIKGKIALIKHTDDGSTQIETPEKNAKFQVYLASSGSYAESKETERAILVCDENGFAESPMLPYGVYVVKQVEGNAGTEFMPEFTVNISENGKTYRFLINNAGFSAYLRVMKTDSTTGKVIPYAGAGFQIYDPDGNLVTMKYTYPELTTIDTFYTASDGTLLTPEKLPYGVGYSLVEVSAPYGYVLDKTPVYFNIAQGDSAQEDGLTVIRVNKENKPQMGTITVKKQGEVFSTVAEKDGIYTPVYNMQGLEGAVFGVYALEDIFTPDKTLRYSAGEKVATLTTSADGIAVSQPLFLGKFEIREEKAPYGMVLLKEPIQTELVYAGQQVEITTVSVTAVNERQKAVISLLKKLETDEQYGIGLGSEYKNAKFGLYATEAIIAADGTAIPKDGLIEIAGIDENGMAVFSADIPVGAKIYVKEYATDSHYLLSDTAYPVEFSYADSSAAAVTIAVNDGEAIENEMIRGSVKGLKVDEDNNPVAGAVFGLFKADETVFNADTALAAATSGEDGTFSFDSIPYGKWKIKELSCPEHLVLSEEITEVIISEKNQVVEITAVNEIITGRVEGVKTDEEDKPIEGVVFGLFARDTTEFTKENALALSESTSEGLFGFEGISYGKYLVKELSCPDEFVMCEDVFEIVISEDGQLISLTVTNKRISGRVQVTKLNSKDHKEKLSGAVFELYLDANKNGVFDVDTDTLYGRLGETETGIYTLDGLGFNGYFLFEAAAPDGFTKDDRYFYFQIQTDGEVVNVENEIGAGFVNEPVPTPEEPVTPDPEYPDSPQTGENSHIWLWMTLAFGSLVSIILLSLTSRKKRKTI